MSEEGGDQVLDESQTVNATIGPFTGQCARSHQTEAPHRQTDRQTEWTLLDGSKVKVATSDAVMCCARNEPFLEVVVVTIPSSSSSNCLRDSHCDDVEVSE